MVTHRLNLRCQRISIKILRSKESKVSFSHPLSSNRVTVESIQCTSTLVLRMRVTRENLDTCFPTTSQLDLSYLPPTRLQKQVHRQWFSNWNFWVHFLMATPCHWPNRVKEITIKETYILYPSLENQRLFQSVTKTPRCHFFLKFN